MAANTPHVTVRVGTPGQHQQGEAAIAGNPAPAAPASGPFALSSESAHTHSANSRFMETKAWMSCVSQSLLKLSEKLRAGDQDVLFG